MKRGINLWQRQDFLSPELQGVEQRYHLSCIFKTFKTYKLLWLKIFENFEKCKLSWTFLSKDDTKIQNSIDKCKLIQHNSIDLQSDIKLEIFQLEDFWKESIEAENVKTERLSEVIFNPIYYLTLSKRTASLKYCIGLYLPFRPG